MKFLHVICHLGLALSVAGAGDCARRYVGLGHAIDAFARVEEPPHVAVRYEEVMAGHPQSDFAVSIYRGQQETINMLLSSTIDNLRGFQDSLRIQGILFGMLVLIFGVISLRLGGATTALQGGIPRSSGSGRT